MNYNTLDYIDSFIDFEKIPRYSYATSFNLERMRAFLQELNNPHKGLKIIHIAGSKGKGSTCAIIASILRQAGYRVGLYTSPHLLDVRERIQVDGLIGEDEFVNLVERIRPVAENFRNHKILGKLSFFEILTAVAFLYFKEKDVDFAILETGLGGRLDATNVCEPIVCGITNISFEHTDKLGGSLEGIAREKAGIVKEWLSVIGYRLSVVSATQKKEVGDVIREVCREKNVRLYEIGKDIKYSIISSTEEKQIFNIEGTGFSYNGLELNLLGAHQVENAAVAIGIVNLIPFGEPVRRSLGEGGRVRVRGEDIGEGLRNISWPGRMQVVQREPYVILDGAQNVASIRAVLSSIKNIFSYKRLVCIFGILSDKDIRGVSIEIDKVSDIVILTRSSNSRAVELLNLKEYFSRPALELTSSVEEAVGKGLEIADKEDLVLITGSLYVVGEAMRFFQDVIPVPLVIPAKAGI